MSYQLDRNMTLCVYNSAWEAEHILWASWKHFRRLCLQQTTGKCGMFYHRPETCFGTKEKRKIRNIDRCFHFLLAQRGKLEFSSLSLFLIFHFSLFPDMRQSLINIWLNIEAKQGKRSLRQSERKIRVVESDRKDIGAKKCLLSTLLFILEPIR